MSRLLQPSLLFAKILQRHERTIVELGGFHRQRSAEFRLCDALSFDGRNCSQLLSTFLAVNYFPRAQLVSRQHYSILFHHQFSERYIIDPCYRSQLISATANPNSDYARYLYDILPPILICSTQNLPLFLDILAEKKGRQLRLIAEYRKLVALPQKA